MGLSRSRSFQWRRPSTTLHWTTDSTTFHASRYLGTFLSSPLMRASNILALVCVLFLTCCDGFHTDTHAYQENDKFEINTISHEDNRHLRSINDADNSEGALNHGNAESNKHMTEHQELTDTTGRENKERTKPLSSSPTTSKSLPTTSTRSAKRVAAISKIMRAVEKSSSFKQLSTNAKKNPKKFRNALAELQKTSGYKNLEKLMGQDPLLAMKDSKRANGVVESRDAFVEGAIALAIITALAVGGGIWLWS